MAFQHRHPAAQTKLGVLYAYGLGVKRDNESARRWYQRAIAQKYLPAQDNLKALEESIKAGQPRTMPQTKERGLQMADFVRLAFVIGLLLTVGLQPVSSDYTSYSTADEMLKAQDRRENFRIEQDKDRKRR